MDHELDRIVLNPLVWALGETFSQNPMRAKPIR